MGKTIVEKILSEHSGRDVKAGDMTIAKVDAALLQDGTGPLAIKQLEEIDLVKAANPERTFIFIDHASPSPRKELSNDHKALRAFAEKTGVRLFDVGEGVCHQIVAEHYINPGDILVGADSHTCTAGGLGAFATGMGSTDVAIALALGKTWFRAPETIKVNIKGKFKKGVYAKDVILYIIGRIGSDGATYKALEFTGPAVKNMSISERLTLCNMAVEAGAKTGVIASDEKTKAYLKKMGRLKYYKKIEADKDAIYEKVIEVDAAKLTPLIAFPHTVDNVKPVAEAKGIKVNQVFIGTCTNGRLDDLKIAARILKGKKVNPKTRLIITPASRDVFIQAEDAGYIKTFLKAGAVVTSAGCGPCVGVHSGILGDDEVCLSTQNRNFKGRMGNPEGRIFLCSPATAAASAIAGEIIDPRRCL
ncbi:MAG: 3-isopropylmalate dehydratase large subunit [Nitrospirae bacterium]|nr:3-isopropylmalate dehydratase large subunit [Nitrospirota bacterium]